MKLLKLTFSIAALSLIFMACGEKNENSEKSTSSETATESPVQKNEEATSSNTIDLSSGSSQTITTNSPGVSQTTPPGINPPHGQPGHVCSIPVGQPLDGSKLNSGSGSTSQISTNNNAGPRINNNAGPRINNNAGPRVGKTPQSSTTTTQTAPGMNPPHGQPGHVCGIPVGSPLPK